MKRTVILPLAVLAFLSSPAQKTDSLPPDTAAVAATANVYADSLAALSERFASWRYEKPDTLSNPYYFPLFASPTLYDGATAQAFRLGGKRQSAQMEAMAAALNGVYTQRPWLIGHLLPAPEAAKPETDAPKEVKPQLTLSDKVTPAPAYDFGELGPVDIVIRKPDFWKLSARFKFQMMQNYFSDNWYQGGESNHSFLADLLVTYNYDNKQKLTFGNKLEARLGFQSSHSDTQHKYKANNDLLRLTNELGVKATKHWFYSAMLQSWTQFYRGYKKNDPKIYSDFLAPFESVLTLGMKYTMTTPNKRFTVNANLSPLAGDFKYVRRPELAKAFGLDEGKRTKLEYGSNVTITSSWTPVTNVTWGTRFYYYTNYSRTLVDWENTFTLKVNRFLSTTIYAYPRFDDSVARKAHDSYLQFKEYLSVGLDLTL